MSEKKIKKPTSEKKVRSEIGSFKKIATDKASPKKRATAKKTKIKKTPGKKAAAEKAAAEKAAAEKAAAEKAAAEKAAAEKAAAEKAAAEKAAAEKAEKILHSAKNNSTPSVNISYDTPMYTESSKKSNTEISSVKKNNKQTNNVGKISIFTLIFLFTAIIFASISNNSKYYMVDKKDKLEIWQGVFAPLGQKQIEVLHNVKIPDTTKKVYSKNEVYPIVSKYYIEKVDSMLEEKVGLPDFENIRQMLLQALAFTSFKTENNPAIYKRLDNIDRVVLTCKSDLLASVGSVSKLNQAILLLEEAKKLTEDTETRNIINQKIEKHKATIISSGN